MQTAKGWQKEEIIEVKRIDACSYLDKAVASISTLAPNGSCLTAKQALAGG